MTRLRLALVASLLVILACAPKPALELPAAPTAGSIRLLLVNDVYVLDTLRDGSGGLARVAWLRDSLARDGRLVFMLAGDVLSPSLLSKWYSGRQMVQAFNTAKLDYATFGNHEFELQRDTLIARIAESRFKWISSNCMLVGGAPFPGVAAWDTLTIGGVRLGVFAVTLTGRYARYVQCTNPDSSAHLAIQELRAAGARVIVGLTHQNLDADSALLAREPELDLILGGHEHEAHEIVVNGRYVVKADANSRSAQLVIVEASLQSARLITFSRGARSDSSTASVTRAWRDSLSRRLGPERDVGWLSTPMDASDAALRRQEMPFGNLVTDAIRAGTAVDVALLNSGTLRLDDVIPAGPVTNYQLESIFLFADETPIVTFSLGGARLRELIEHSLSNANHGRGGFLQVAGISFSYDLARPQGSRVVGEMLRSDGRPILQADTLKVAFGAYPACDGGDGYSVPEAAEGDACSRSRRGPRAVDLLMDHITRGMQGRIEPPPTGRINRVQRP